MDVGFKNQTTISQGGMVTLDILVFSRDPEAEGTLVDADIVPAYSVYYPNGTLLISGNGIHDATGKYHANVAIPIDAILSNAWYIQWNVIVGGNLLPLDNTREYFIVTSAEDRIPSQTNRVGWMFGNYQPPAGLWGDILTPDDMRYYLGGWGIPLTARNKEIMDDPYLIQILKAATQEFQRKFNVSLIKTRYAFFPNERHTIFQGIAGRDTDFVKSKKLPNGTYDGSGNYDELDEPWDYDRQRFENYIYIKLRRHPIISIDFAHWVAPTRQRILNLTTWAKLNHLLGSVEFFPDTSILSEIYAVGSFPFVINPTRYQFYPDAFLIDYTVGYENSAEVPDDFREIIGRMAECRILHDLGKGMQPGLASHSTSIQGVSENFTYTQTANATMFSAYIKEAKEFISDYYKDNKYRIGGFTFGAL